MILLTADRPPELRQTGANQTIDQPDIFGDYVRWRFDLPAPDPAIDPAMVLTTVDQAAYRARRTPQGPVHLNLMFREPFLPERGTSPASGPSPWTEGDEPYTRYAATKPAVDETEIQPPLANASARETGPRRRRTAGLPQAGRGGSAARRRSRLAATPRHWLPGPSRRGLGEPRRPLRRASGR